MNDWIEIETPDPVCDENVTAQAVTVFNPSWKKVSEAVSPRMSITGGSITDGAVRVGLDWVKVYVYGDAADPEGWSARWADLKKEALKESDNRFFTMGQGSDKVSCEMKAHGVGKFKVSMPFFFKAPGIDIGLADIETLPIPTERETKKQKEIADRQRPIAMFEIKGSFCYGLHHKQLIQYLYWWCVQLGIDDVELRLSRVDIAVDVDGHSINHSVRALMDERAVCLARKGAIYWEANNFTGVKYGAPGAETSLTIYDKVQDLQRSPEKRAAWIAAYDKIPDVMTRYEFRLMRDGLVKRHSMATVEDLEKKLGSLVQYLLNEWYRENDADDAANGRRTNESAVSSEWAAIADGAHASVGRNQEIRCKRETPPADVESLVSQAMGCLTSAAARLQLVCKSPSELIGTLWRDLGAAFNEARGRTREKLIAVRTYWANLRQETFARSEVVFDLMGELVDKGRQELKKGVPIEVLCYGPQFPRHRDFDPEPLDPFQTDELFQAQERQRKRDAEFRDRRRSAREANRLRRQAQHGLIAFE